MAMHACLHACIYMHIYTIYTCHLCNKFVSAEQKASRISSFINHINPIISAHPHILGTGKEEKYQEIVT